MKHLVNWWAILVSAIVFFLFGWLWYDVLFGKAWLAALGLTQAQQTAMGGGTAYPFILSLVMAFFCAYGIARALSWRADYSAARGAFIGLSLGLLIFGSMTWMDYTYEMRGATLTLIEIGYVVIGMGIMGLILGAWKPRA
jgi:uncharacterized protein DUF1761